MQCKTYSIVYFQAKKQEKLTLKELRARATVCYRRIETSEGTNQIRGFPIEHGLVSTNKE